ncbi:putative ribonuclease H-like domain-containing protein [Tanacetum coccineum]
MASSSSSSSREKHSKARLEIHCYELALDSLEARILGHERNELAWGENQMSARDKTGLGYDTQLNELSSNSETDSEISLSVFDVRSSDAENTPKNDRLSKDGFHAIPPLITGNFLTLRADISFASYANQGSNKEKVIIEDWTSDDEDEVSNVQTVSPVKTSETKTVNTRTDKIGVLTRTRLVHTAKPISTARPSVSTAKPVNIARPDQAVVDSGCSSHMTGNKAYLSDYEDYNGGFVAFGSDPKGDELKFNLFSVLQMCDKKNSVLFTETECLILSPSFKLFNESQVVLRAPRKDDVYNLDLKNIVPFGEVKNYTMNEFYGKKGIKREFSVAKTPQQNGVAERKNRTLIEGINSLGKFDGKSDEGYLLGYSTTRTGPNWMFDLDFLINTMNYIPVSIENQVYVDAGTQNYYVAGKDNEYTQEYILLPLHPHRTRSQVEAIVQDAQVKPSKNVSKDKNVQNSEDVSDKEEQHQMSDAEHALQDELEKMVAQEVVAQAVDDATRQAFEDEKRKNASTKKVAQATSTNTLSTGRPSVSTANIVSAASTPTSANTDLPTDPKMPGLEDDFDVIPNEGIFSRAYDDEDVGAEADFNNMDNTIDVSPIPTLRINKDHPKRQILGDPTSAVQTRGKLQKASSTHQSLDESWVEAMQEELLQFKLQKVWVIVNLPYGKKVTGTKWVFRNKRDERSIVVKNKARLVAQGFRQEEGIDYDEVFAPVARIEAIRLFLAFASYIGFTVYQMDVKSAFLYGTIGEESIRTATTPIESNKPLVKDEDGVDVDVHVYRSMIGSLMYLTASRPDIMFAVCACARFQVTPKASYLNAVKRIFRYLKHQPKLGLWYPKDSPFELEAYSDNNYGGASLDRKSTTGGCQFLGRRLISWQCKKQTIVANSTTEVEYVVATNCYGQVLWIQNQMMDYGFNFMNTKIHIDNESTISVIKNPVSHSRTKHIEIRFHFIRDCYEKRLIEVVKIHTDNNVTDLLTKGFDVTRFNFLVVSIRMKNMDLKMDGRCADNLSLIWLQTANVKTLADGTQQLIASIDNKDYTIIEASVRSKLKLADAIGIGNLSDAEIYEGLGTLGGYVGDHVPLLPAMLAGAAQPPFDPVSSTSQPPILTTDELLQPTLPPRSPHRQEPEIPQSQGPTPTIVADEATTTGMGVDTEGATTTTSGLDAGLDSGNIHESPLSLEKELKDTKQTFGNSILTLVDKVKLLEGALKRKSKKIVLSDSEDEETEAQGRKIQRIDDDPLVSLVRDFVTPIKSKVSASGEAQEEDISPTTLEAAKTLTRVASLKAKSTDKGRRYKRRKISKGKDINTGLDDEADINAGNEDINTGNEDINTGFEEVNTGSIRVSTGSGPDVIRAKLEANAELTKSVLGKDLPEEDFAKRMVDLVNQRKKYFAEERAKAKRKEFDKLVKQIDTFVPMGFEATKAKLKRYGEELQTRIPKKQNIDDKDVQPTEEKVTEVKEEEPVKRIGKRKKLKARKRVNVDKSSQRDSESNQEESMEAMNPTPVATKSHVIVNWKIFLQDFTREDLIELYRLVIKKYRANRPEDAFDRVLWSDLKTMFDLPLSEDATWSLPLQQKILNWRYYDSYGVCKAMLDKKLQGDKKDEACYKLLKLIEKQAGIKWSGL